MGWWSALLCMWLFACGGNASGADACKAAAKARKADAQVLCERAWQATRDVAVAVAAAQHALVAGDQAALKKWVERAPEDIEGARIIHFWGAMQQELGDLAGAEATFRHALALRVDRDPLRATNTAQHLLDLVHGYRPAEESLRVARVAWQQANRANDPLVLALNSTNLITLLIDLGELETAEALLVQMPAEPAVLRDTSEGLIQSARGRSKVAISLFERATKRSGKDEEQWASSAQIALVKELVHEGRDRDAQRALDLAMKLRGSDGGHSIDSDAELAAARASVALARNDAEGALAIITDALVKPSRDATRVLLHSIQGDALDRRGDVEAAETAWRQAADLLEDWRASIPSTQLRSGLVAQHRHALEAWLDARGARGDAIGALEIVRRTLGRALLDRVRQREANAPASVDASILDIVERLELRRELAAPVPDLESLPAGYDLFAFMVGARSVWVLRHVGGAWSIERVGDRQPILDLIDAHVRDPDDLVAAQRLGTALFPQPPKADVPFAVLLDHPFSDVALAGLRTHGRFLVEYAPVLEVLSPELLFYAVQPATGDAVAIGDPLGDLPAAAREVRALGRRISVQEYVGPRATHAALEGARTASLLHVAAHSTVMDGRAALLLHDKPLSSADIMNSKIGPRLAVIATCRSHAADDPSISLVAAFLAAGASGVVGVKRALRDSEGAQMMDRFYAADGARDPVRALSVAQRMAIRAGGKPSTWAVLSFFGVGGWLHRKDTR